LEDSCPYDSLQLCAFYESTVRAQELPLAPDARNPRDLLASNVTAAPAHEGLTFADPMPNALFPNVNSAALPNKPQPVADEGPWIGEGEPLPRFSSDLIRAVRKDDGRMMWHVEKVNSCAWFGAPVDVEAGRVRQKSFLTVDFAFGTGGCRRRDYTSPAVLPSWYMQGMEPAIGTNEIARLLCRGRSDRNRVGW
jgi:hypothetical protein